MFHYVACGLPNVHLVNGVAISNLANGQEMFTIEDPKGLHRAIGMHLVQKDSALSGDEFRFLRTEMLMSRKSLGELFNISPETIKKYESGENPVPKTIDALLRSLFKEFHNEASKINELVKLINHAEQQSIEDMRFEETDDGWREADCA